MSIKRRVTPAGVALSAFLPALLLTACGQTTSFVEQEGLRPPASSPDGGEKLPQESLDALAKSSFGPSGDQIVDSTAGGSAGDGAGDGATAGDAGDGAATAGGDGMSTAGDTAGGSTAGGDSGGSAGSADEATGGSATAGATSGATAGATAGGDDGMATAGDTAGGGDTGGGDTGGMTAGDTGGGDTGGMTAGDTTSGDTGSSTAGGSTGSTTGGGSSGDSTGGGTGMGSGGTGAGTGDEGGGFYVDKSLEMTQPPPGKVDILWVVDVSGSMSEEQTYLGQNFTNFINALSGSGIDFTTAVTSTDACHDQVPDDLAQRVCPVEYGGTVHHRGTFIGNQGEQILMANQPDLVDKFREYTSLGISGSGFEHGLYSSQLAIAKTLGGGNPAFLREGAHLAVIVVSDEEDDGIGLGMLDAYTNVNFVAQGATTFRYTDDDLISYLGQHRPAGKFSVSAITGTRLANGSMCSAPHSQPKEEGTQYIKAAQKTGGVIQSICDTNWSQSLTDIGKDLASQITQIALEGTPDPSSIKVYVNGTETSAWTYISASKSVKFNADSVPAPGSAIRVTYRTLP
jgi:hypothetical protein